MGVPAEHIAERTDSSVVATSHLVALNRLLEGAAHDLRGPITVISEFASILLDGLAGAVSTAQREHLQMIADGANELDAAVRDLLDIGRFETGTIGTIRRRCRIAEIIDPLRERLAAKAALHQVQLEISVVDEVPTLYCDAGQVTRVVSNLVMRAFRSAGDDGSVRIRIRRSETSAANVTLDIENDGPTIPAEKLQMLQDRCVSLEADDSADLAEMEPGLLVAFQLIEANLGDITVSSDPGRGTCFCMTLPTDEPMALTRRFLRHAASLRTDTAYASIYIIRTDGCAEPSPLLEFASLLQHHLRRSDLILALNSHAWFALLSGNSRNAAAVIRRFEDAWSEANANRPGRSLPRMTIETKGFWRIEQEREALLSEIGRIFADAGK